jgi:hypothetical protein
MTKHIQRTILLTTLAFLCVTAAQAAKVNVCHFPPGNPDNWQTISISENALNAHLNHGDLAGSCLANCETICDDGDACTQDVESDAESCSCLAVPTAVDCDDSNPCTADSCSSAAGACVYDTAILNGTACDDGDAETSGDVCTNSFCAGTSVCSTGPTCIDAADCSGLPTAVYQSCNSCTDFFICFNGSALFGSCAGGTVYDDSVKGCVQGQSTTCTACGPAPEL